MNRIINLFKKGLKGYINLYIKAYENYPYHPFV